MEEEKERGEEKGSFKDWRRREIVDGFFWRALLQEMEELEWWRGLVGSNFSVRVGHSSVGGGQLAI